MIKNKETAKKLDIKKLFQNNKFLILISFIIACTFWIGTAINASDASDRVIYNIPVNMEFPQDSGLVAFSGSDISVSVPISGNRLTIGAVTGEDIQVSAITNNTGAIVAGTNNTFQLQAKKNSTKSDYELGTPTPALINVFVDKLLKKDFPIDYEISYKIDPSYYGDQLKKSAETVNISGPETEVSKISKVVVTSVIDGNLTASKTIDAPVKMYDSSGTEIQSDYITLSVETVEVTIPVLPEKKVPLNVEYLNVPTGLDTSAITVVSPSEIQIAGPESTINELSSISLGPIDFAKISPTTNSYKVDIAIPSDCINITNVNTAEVTIDLTGYTTKTFTVTNLSTANVPSGYTANVTTTTLDVVIVGPEATLEELTDSDISAVLDLNAVSTVEGSVSIDAKINVNKYNACWASGVYKANVNVKKLT